MGYVAIISKSQVPVQRGIDGKRNHPLGSNLKTRTHVLLGRAILHASVTGDFHEQRAVLLRELYAAEALLRRRESAEKSANTREEASGLRGI